MESRGRERKTGQREKMGRIREEEEGEKEVEVKIEEEEGEGGEKAI